VFGCIRGGLKKVGQGQKGQNLNQKVKKPGTSLRTVMTASMVPRGERKIRKVKG